MLQNMQKKVEAEADKEQKLYDKFMCYCKNAGGDLSASISAAESKVPEVGSDIKEAEAKNAQLKEDLKQHQVDRSAAKAAIAQATAIRGKEEAEYTKLSSDYKANIAAVSKATTAIEKGMAGGFLQTNAAQLLRRVVASQNELQGADRDDILAFLSGTQQGSDAYAYAPSGGEITGILKTLNDQMTASLSKATAAEKAAITDFDGLVAAKTKEVESLTSSIEQKTGRVGELSVRIVEMKNDLSDTQAALEEDKKFLAGLDKNCATKTKEWEVIVKTRSEELQALAETVKILNDDDALELFKKTLPGSASLVQVKVSATTQRAGALAVLENLRSQKNHPFGLDFVTLAIKGKKIGFDKVIKMIDDMVATLKKEQMDDDNKKEYCEKQFETANDKKEGLQKTIRDTDAQMEDAKEGIKTLVEEIKAMEDGIKALDKSVAEATDQRKEEHEDFVELMASDSAAKELLKFAVNRLNKFYNPKLYKAPPKRVLSEEDQITVNMGGTLAPTAAPGGIAGTGVTVLAQAPPPPPEAPGAYKKKSEESTGVIAMIDLLMKDLDKEMTEAEVTEKDAQAEYEAMMTESASKRAADTKALTEKGATKAELESDVQGYEEDGTSATKELMATEQYISSLHAECDWLLQYFSVRKEARDAEIDSMTKAKAVLSGADFSLVQTHAHTFLRHARKCSPVAFSLTHL